MYGRPPVGKSFFGCFSKRIRLPRRLVELIIVRTAQIVGSNYELNQHIPFMRMCGYSDAEIAAVPKRRVSSLFDDKQRALLGYVDQMASRGDVDDQTFATLENSSRRKKSSRSAMRSAATTRQALSRRR